MEEVGWQWRIRNGPNLPLSTDLKIRCHYKLVSFLCVCVWRVCVCVRACVRVRLCVGGGVYMKYSRLNEDIKICPFLESVISLTP